jgi:type II secretory ATPase GspE/PulE/Tfp pilus assembly ATPase PilB-like protein
MTVNDGIPFSELDHFTLDRPTMQRLRQRFCEQWQVVVLGEWSDDPGKPVTVGMPDPRDERLVDHLVHLLARPVEAVRLNHYELDKALDFAFERRPLHEGADGVPVPMRGPEPAATASTADLLNHLVRTAVRVDASDIHIEHYVDDVDVRLRVDGVLRQLFTHITPANVAQVVGRIKVLARLDITERRLPQDGRIRVLLIDGDHRVPVDLRVSTAPGPTGEDVVMRVVEQTAGVMPLSGLGLPPRMLDRLVDLLENPEGMVIVTGPTGSGKTSTLYAGLDEIRGNHRKIVTAEDPIERFIPKVNQKQVGSHVDMATLTRAFLRQDPDVMLIGEIRDEETARVASRAAITGHLVLSTLHTSDAVAAVPRLVGLGLSSVDVADSLLGVVAQRLVRRLCRHCKHPAPPDDPATRRLRPLLGAMAPWVAGGCERCAHTGYAGRVGLFELLVVDEDLAAQIAAGVPSVQLRQWLRERGHTGLVDAARSAIESGTTSPAEVLRVMPVRALATMLSDRTT